MDAVTEKTLDVLGPQPVGADETGASIIVGEHERDLGLERLAQLGTHEVTKLPLGPGPIYDRDDLRSPCRLDEPPPQLVRVAQSGALNAATTTLWLRSPFAPRALPISPRVKTPARAGAGEPNARDERLQLALRRVAPPNHALRAAQSKTTAASHRALSWPRALVDCDTCALDTVSGVWSQISTAALRSMLVAQTSAPSGPRART